MQAKTWHDCFEQYIECVDLLTSGYKIVDGQLAIDLCPLNGMPEHEGLETCGQCKRHL